MAATQREPNNLGVMMIDSNPVVREGPQSILAKDGEIEL